MASTHIDSKPVAKRDQSPTRKAEEKRLHILVIGLGEEGCHTATAMKRLDALTAQDREYIHSAHRDVDVAYHLATAEYSGWDTGPDHSSGTACHVRFDETHIVWMSE